MARLFHRAELLERFYTDVYSGQAFSRVLRCVPEPWQPAPMRRLLGRLALDLPRERVRSFPLFGTMYYARRSLAADREALTAVHLWAGTAFGNRVARDGFGTAGAVYTFNTAALEILRAAQRRGLFTVVEQTIAPRALEEDLLAAEQARFPHWDPQDQHGYATEATITREADEWALADVIVCGSEFVRNGIAACGGPVERCTVIPYGMDGRFSLPRRYPCPGLLRVLTVGQVGLRKGAAYALETARLLQGVAEFRWVGPISVTAQAQAQLAEYVQLTGAVPRSRILQHYDWANVFLLPSICEGSATVTYEALSCGLPVVTTPHAGSTVQDGVDGFIVPVRDSEAMADRLRQLHEDRKLLARMSAGAIESARELSLAAYQERLLRALRLAMMKAMSPLGS